MGNNFKIGIKTKIAFLLLLSPLIYTVQLIMFSLITALLEQPCNKDGIYLVFAGISVFLSFFLPFCIIGTGCGSVVMQILALRNGESKIKNFLMMFISIIYLAAGFVLLNNFWEASMSV